jgi:serine/threonine protein kinase
MKNDPKETDELLNILIFDKFQTQALIGEGSFGKVYKGINITNGSKVAIKIVNKILRLGS